MADFNPDGQMIATWHIRAGATFIKNYQWKTGEPAVGVDLTGWTARLHVRVKVEDTTPVLSLSTGSGITLDASGNIAITITAAQATTLEGAAGKKLVFDLELERTADGFIRNLVGGTIVTYPNVTRE